MDFIDLMEECAPNVSHQTMAAIVRQESNFNPYAIGINGDYVLERQPQSKQEAIDAVNWLAEKGQTNLDLGLGQISEQNRVIFDLSIEESFDPCQNIQVASTILTDNYTRAINSGLEQQAALQAAISEYNTGSQTAGFSNGYVQKVLNNVKPDTTMVPTLTYTDGNNVNTSGASINDIETKQEIEKVYSFSDDNKEYIFNSRHAVDSSKDIFVYGNK